MEPVAIEDPADPRLAPYAAMRERDLVGREGRFIVEGEVTLRLLASGRARFRAESVLLAPERRPGLEGVLAALAAPVYLAGKAVMSAVTGFPIHRGVLAVGLRGPEPEPAALIPPAPAPALVLGLAGLTNHDNVGAAFRNAAAFGADAVLLDRASCDPLYRKAIRVSAGAALITPFARLGARSAEVDTGSAQESASKQVLGAVSGRNTIGHGSEPREAWPMLAARLGLELLALSPTGRETLAGLVPPRRALLLLGSEGPGLPADLMARVRTVRIPMEAGFDSLNVATAGAIALHHLAGARWER